MTLDICRCGEPIVLVEYRNKWFSAEALEHADECPLGGDHHPTDAVG